MYYVVSTFENNMSGYKSDEKWTYDWYTPHATKKKAEEDVKHVKRHSRAKEVKIIKVKKVKTEEK